MIIVSQNKDQIINFSIMNIVELAKKGTSTMVRAENRDDTYELAEYKTEERAKEVFEELMQRYENWENMKYGQPSGVCNPVYEMPEE